jgi:hypothetical protein
MPLPVGSGFSWYFWAKVRIQLSTAWAETRRRKAMRFIEMPLK